ncbi:MAG: hypothetical protein FWH56_04705 [Betaproteobacteria bacterium]|nr:hypothetical protein [Betaproteobacteria bacterium]
MAGPFFFLANGILTSQNHFDYDRADRAVESLLRSEKLELENQGQISGEGCSAIEVSTALVKEGVFVNEKVKASLSSVENWRPGIPVHQLKGLLPGVAIAIFDGNRCGGAESGEGAFKVAGAFFGYRYAGLGREYKSGIRFIHHSHKGERPEGFDFVYQNHDGIQITTISVRDPTYFKYHLIMTE